MLVCLQKEFCKIMIGKVDDVYVFKLMNYRPGSKEFIKSFVGNFKQADLSSLMIKGETRVASSIDTKEHGIWKFCSIGNATLMKRFQKCTRRFGNWKHYLSLFSYFQMSDTTVADLNTNSEKTKWDIENHDANKVAIVIFDDKEEDDRLVFIKKFINAPQIPSQETTYIQCDMYPQLEYVI
ncbi:hypothetical protein K501DRAFT_280056 [Backusella circina FSU 941]|nr:hypothetical protein K501DRAFT_280056 [Backusella circina FSU 941]